MPPARPWYRTRLVRCMGLAAVCLAAAWFGEPGAVHEKPWFLAQLLPVGLLAKILAAPVALGGEAAVSAVILVLAVAFNGLLIRAVWSAIAPLAPGTAPPTGFDPDRPQRCELGCLVTFAVVSAAIAYPGYLGAREKVRTAACDALWAPAVDDIETVLPCLDVTGTGAEPCPVNPRNTAQPGYTTREPDPCQVRITQIEDGRLAVSQTASPYTTAKTRTFSITLAPDR